MKPGHPNPPDYDYCNTCHNQIAVEFMEENTCTWCVELREEQDETLEW